MRPVFFVKREEADAARAIEAKLLGLPLSSGILFAGVSMQQGSEKSLVYRIWVGCHRDYDEKVVEMVVKHALLEQIEKGLSITIEVHRGISRAPVAKVVDTGT